MNKDNISSVLFHFRFGKYPHTLCHQRDHAHTNMYVLNKFCTFGTECWRPSWILAYLKQKRIYFDSLRLSHWHIYVNQHTLCQQRDHMRKHACIERVLLIQNCILAAILNLSTFPNWDSWGLLICFFRTIFWADPAKISLLRIYFTLYCIIRLMFLDYVSTMPLLSRAEKSRTICWASSLSSDASEIIHAWWRGSPYLLQTIGPIY